MKIIALATAALVMAATTASADRLARNNVACDGGSVYGFTVQGADGLTHYVKEKNLGYCPAGTVGVPASVDIYEPDEVVEWLADNGIEITDIRLRDGRVSRAPIIVTDANGNIELDDQGQPVTRIKARRSAPVNGGW
jgi:hypothetical protein